MMVNKFRCDILSSETCRTVNKRHYSVSHNTDLPGDNLIADQNMQRSCKCN